jgi:hypothetical protein
VSGLGFGGDRSQALRAGLQRVAFQGQTGGEPRDGVAQAAAPEE